MKKLAAVIVILVLFGLFVNAIPEEPEEAFEGTWAEMQIQKIYKLIDLIKMNLKSIKQRVNQVEQDVFELFIEFTDLQTALEDLEEQFNEFIPVTQKLVVLEDGDGNGWELPAKQFVIQDEDVTEQSVVSITIFSEDDEAERACMVMSIVDSESFTINCEGPDAMVGEGSALNYVVFTSEE